MRNFQDSERYCSQLFDSSGPFWHLWSPENGPLLFASDDDFMAGMGIVGICALLCPEVKIYTFELMNNHVHFTVGCVYNEAMAFAGRLKKYLQKWLASSGKTPDLSGWSLSARAIESLRDFRNVVAYNNRNGFLVNPEETPFSYPWGANRYFFNREAKLRFDHRKNKRTMSKRMRRGLIRTHDADHIIGPVMMDGYACPLSFCAITEAEQYFRNASHYLSTITRNIESQKEIAAEIGERLYYNDNELFAACVRLAADRFGESRPSVLAKDDKIILAKALHYDYNAGNKQICRMLNLDPGIVNALFPQSQ